MKERVLTLFATLLLCISVAVAQNITVRGVVTSADDGEPIIGASVLVQGTTQGTATDLDGKFTLANVPTGSILTVSYVGMTTQEVKATTAPLSIALETSAAKLDEVMVVAFGNVKKSAFTGAATVIDADQISSHVTSNVSDALVGSVAGLQMRGSSGAPGSSGDGSINIRGIASLFASTEPLIIVDGAPYPMSLSNISPSDIESVTVLKDAASAALYGARGAAGVIIVTTKKGKSHNAIINAEARWGVNTRAVPEYDIIKDPAAYYEAFYAQAYNKYFYGQGMSAAAANVQANATMLNNLQYNVYNVPDGQLLIGTNGKINPNATLGNTYTAANGTTYYLTPDDWNDLAYRSALRQEYSLSINGGNDVANYYTSVNYLNEDGIIRYSDYDRLNARFKGEYQAKKWLKFGLNAGYVHSNTNANTGLDTSLGANNLSYYTTMLAPIYPAYVRVVDPTTGTISIRRDAQGNLDYDFGVPTTDYYGLKRPTGGTGNPLATSRYDTTTSKFDQLNATMNGDVLFTDWLKFSANSTIIWGETQYSLFNNPYVGSSASVNGALTKSVSTTRRTNNVQTLTFDRDFDLHHVNALVGHEYYKVDSKYLAASAQGAFSTDILEINAFANKVTSSSYTTGYNVEGYFLSAQYDYNNRYFGSFSYRRDASSRFAKSHRWGDFWSVGGAWMISQEKFMESTSNWLSQLKIKLSIGQQGNDNIGNWAYTDLYSIAATTNTSMSPTFYRIGNEDITWETTTNLNAGLEFILWKGRLSGNVEFYNKTTTDLLFWLQVPESIGTRGYYGNIGDIRNRGIELALTANLVQSKIFDWSVSANISHNATKILKLPESKTADNGGFTSNYSTSGTTFWYAEGQPLYNAFVAKYAGVNEQGEALYWVDADLDGKDYAQSRPGKNLSYTTTDYNSATRYAEGSILPKVFGGFSTSVRLYSFDFNANFDYQIGGKVADFRYASYMSPESGSSGGSNIHKDYLKSWSPNNTSSTIPRWQLDDQYTIGDSRVDRFLTNASYFNFSSFTVGYTLPKNLTQKALLDKVRVYVMGENLGFVSARKGFDPRNSFSENTVVSDYSPARNISGGVQLTF